LGRSHFKTESKQIEQYLSGVDRAQTAKDIAEGIGMRTSAVYTLLQLMEIFGTVLKVKRGGRQYYLPPGVYDDEQISAMLPPKKVKKKPKPRRRRSILRSVRRSELPVRKSFLDQHLSDMRVRAISGEGPSALAMIGLTQREPAREEFMIEELTAYPDIELIVEEEKFETPMKLKTPMKSEPFGTVKHLPKDVRRLTLMQIKYLHEQLKFLDGYQRISSFNTVFARSSALGKRKYGGTLYFSMGTNSWDNVRKVTIDPSISDMIVLPVFDLKRWSSWNGFLMGLKETRIKYGKTEYDKIIDQFIETDHKLVEITVENRKANYVQSILNKRIGKRGLEEQIKASHVNNWLYLEKVD